MDGLPSQNRPEVRTTTAPGRQLVAVCAGGLTAAWAATAWYCWYVAHYPFPYTPDRPGAPGLIMAAWLASTGAVNGVGWYWAIVGDPAKPVTRFVRIGQRILAGATLAPWALVASLILFGEATQWEAYLLRWTWFFLGCGLFYFAFAPTDGRRWVAACQVVVAVWMLVISGFAAICSSYTD